jgi:hypothetical protein
MPVMAVIALTLKGMSSMRMVSERALSATLEALYGIDEHELAIHGADVDDSSFGLDQQGSEGLCDGQDGEDVCVKHGLYDFNV